MSNLRSFCIQNMADQIDEILTSKAPVKDRNNRQAKTLKFWDTILETCGELGWLREHFDGSKRSAQAPELLIGGYFHLEAFG
jgi:hypothetical protein